jgi:DNA-binding MarR family transcriptional regulator
MRKTVDPINELGEAPVDDSPEAVLEAIHTVMHRYRARQYRAGAGAPDGITHLEGKVLGFFARHPGASLRDLVGQSGRDKGQLARLIGGLRERGLMVAEADPVDRRSVRLRLSAEGEALQQALQREGRRVAKAAVAGLSAAERHQLVSLLAKVRANIDAAG